MASRAVVSRAVVSRAVVSRAVVSGAVVSRVRLPQCPLRSTSSCTWWALIAAAAPR